VSPDKETITFYERTGRKYRMYHEQDCCERVQVEDIVGSLKSLVNSPILEASERTSDTDPERLVAINHDESFTWTFYVISTIKGTVTLRWLGESNGCYSEGVSFEEVLSDGRQNI
jgi:hypothetical protein